MNNTLSLTEGKLISTLIKFTVPVMLSLLLQIGYGMVDLLVVGQFGTIGDVSAVTIGSQLLNLVTQLCAGLSMGTTIIVAQAVGAKRGQDASKGVGASIVFFFWVGLLLMGGVVFGKALFAKAMNTPVQSLQETQDYLFYIGFGLIFVVFYNLLGSVLRAIGDSKTPLLTVFIAFIFNVLLDLLFVAYFDMGAKGAALATAISQGISVLITVWVLARKTLPFKLTINDFKKIWASLKAVLRLGMPVALQGVLIAISFMAITAIANSFGVFESAAVGIVEKATGLIMIVPLAFTQSLSAFTAQNVGAGYFLRAKKGLLYSVAMSLAIGLVTAYIAYFHGTLFTRIFTSDLAVTEHALLYLKTYGYDAILVCFLFCLNGYFNGLGKTTFVMLHSVISAVGLRIPLAYFFSQLENTNLFWVGLGTPIATSVQIVVCIAAFFWVNNPKRRMKN